MFFALRGTNSSKKENGQQLQRTAGRATWTYPADNYRSSSSDSPIETANIIMECGSGCLKGLAEISSQLIKSQVQLPGGQEDDSEIVLYQLYF